MVNVFKRRKIFPHVEEMLTLGIDVFLTHILISAYVLYEDKPEKFSGYFWHNKAS
jgi:hypothetical protein